MNSMDENAKREIQKMIDVAIAKAVNYPVRKRGDTPTDTLQLTPRGYVDMTATTAKRPASIVSMKESQQFFNLTTGYPWFFNPNSSVWVSATGSTVGGN